MTLILPQVNFIEDFRCYKAGDSVEFREPLTVITGDNGSGKSTLISTIRQLFKSKWTASNENQAKDKIEKTVPDGITIGYLDLSQDLYKGSPEFDFDNMPLFLKCMGSSSGEGVIFQLSHFLDANVNVPLIILDEPERGLSIRMQLIMSKLICHHRAKYPDQQMLITTHSRLFMDLAVQVYSTTHRSYISPTNYIKYMLNQ